MNSKEILEFHLNAIISYKFTNFSEIPRHTSRRTSSCSSCCWSRNSCCGNTAGHEHPAPGPNFYEIHEFLRNSRISTKCMNSLEIIEFLRNSRFAKQFKNFVDIPRHTSRRTSNCNSCCWSRNSCCWSTTGHEHPAPDPDFAEFQIDVRESHRNS